MFELSIYIKEEIGMGKNISVIGCDSFVSDKFIEPSLVNKRGSYYFMSEMRVSKRRRGFYYTKNEALGFRFILKRK